MDTYIQRNSIQPQYVLLIVLWCGIPLSGLAEGMRDEVDVADEPTISTTDSEGIPTDTSDCNSVGTDTSEPTQLTTSDDSDTTGSACRSTIDDSAGLNIDQLIERIKQTKAIGFLTKLALKGDVEQIIRQVTEYSGQRADQELLQVRQQFEGLVLKAITLLGEKDPGLAQDIYKARHFVWQSMLEVKT
ncbi:MAG: hypothetical protein OEU36_22670 [Gammaproteobacteria bacterium]|nr:hypothetical protein [Gammaproteobacteria bacterium]